MRLPDEVAQHLLGGVEIGDNAVTHGLDRGDRTRGAADHGLRLGAYRFDSVADTVERDDGGLAEHDSLAAGKNAGIGGAQVDSQIIREHRKRAEHTGLQSENGSVARELTRLHSCRGTVLAFLSVVAT